MELTRAADVAVLSNSGVTSRQLLSPENSRSARVTITRVSVAPGSRNPSHRHAVSEQVWVVLRGSGRLLLENGQSLLITVGDIVRFEDDEEHGFENTGEADFEYLSVTAPPVNFRSAYAEEWK